MEPVLYHNQEDILSLLGVVIVGSLIFSAGEGKEMGLADAMDLFGAARVMEKVGEIEKSVYFYEKSLAGSLSEEVSIMAKRKLSHYFKKKDDWSKALSFWREIASSTARSSAQLYSLRELAMYLEHKQKNYEEARKIAEEGFVLSMGLSSYYQKDFAHRLERLKQKMRRQKEKGIKG